jgi:hypothetical protein
VSKARVRIVGDPEDSINHEEMTKMVTVEELRQKFPVQNVAPHGDCIVVPGHKFDPDWEVFLGDQGYKCFMADLGGKPVTLVKLKTQAKAESGKQVYQPEDQSKSNSKGELPLSTAEFPWSDEDEEKLLRRMNELDGTVFERAAMLMPEFPGRSAVALRQKFYKLTGLKGSSKRKARPRPSLLHAPWTAEDEEVLINLWNKRLTRHAIAQKMQGRSEEAVQNRLKRLQEAGRIKPRWVQKKKKEPEKREKPAEVGRELSTSEKSKTTESPSTTESTEGLESVQHQMISLLKEIRDFLKPKSFDFEYACRECGNTGSAHGAEKIWRFCSVCGKPLILWNVEAS